MKNKVTYVFIDGQNMNLAIKNDFVGKTGRLLYKGKRIDYKKLNMYLKDKYHASRQIIFLGYLPENEQLYKYFRHCGFEIIFKKTTTMKIRGKEKIKGNVDIDIAVYSAARLFEEYDRAIFISGDGDFLELYDFINERKKLYKIIVPNSFSYSRLLGKYRKKLIFLNYNIRQVVQDKKLTRFAGRDAPLGLSGHRDDKNIVSKELRQVKPLLGDISRKKGEK
jgi:uncharacterized LabA/DUF88 family protein